MSGQDPASEELAAWLALARVPGVGQRARERLLERFGTARDALAASRRERGDLGLDERAEAAFDEPDWEAVETDLRWAEGPDHCIVRETASDYPPLLRELADPPPLLYCHGDPGHLRDPGLAMVGSRNPTHQGRETAEAFAAALSRMGLVITSGLAMGVDAAAHRGALKAGGPTVAVLGCGPDIIYPRSNADIAERIVGQGCLVSEFPPGTGPRRSHFPRRNRIIAALSVGTLVVEAALRSGSLITARLAAEQGREVFAVPGSIHNPLARGCHRLIRAGAKLVESTDDIFEELRSLSLLEPAESTGEATRREAPPADRTESDPAYRSLLEAVDYAPTPMDRIVERSGLTAADVSSMLLMLEMEGRVESAPGGRYTRRS